MSIPRRGDDEDELAPLDDTGDLAPEMLPHRSRKLPKLPQEKLASMTKKQLAAWHKFCEEYKEELEEETRREWLRKQGY